MARELTRGEKAKRTRIKKIGLKAYKAEMAARGRKGGANSPGQFDRDRQLASKAGSKSKRLPKAILKSSTDPELHYEDDPDLKISPVAKEPKQ